jgi:hypothetical protein
MLCFFIFFLHLLVTSVGRVSELRAVELLEDLCDNMASYTLVSLKKSKKGGPHRWLKFEGEGAVSIDADKR